MLERDSLDANGNFVTVASSMGTPNGPASVSSITNTSTECTLQVEGIYDSRNSSIFSSIWTLSLQVESRYLGVNVVVQPLPSILINYN